MLDNRLTVENMFFWLSEVPWSDMEGVKHISPEELQERGLRSNQKTPEELM